MWKVVISTYTIICNKQAQRQQINGDVYSLVKADNTHKTNGINGQKADRRNYLLSTYLRT